MTLTAPLADALALALDAPAPYARALATDADGTLWDTDVGDALFRTVAERELFRGAGLAKLRAHARALLPAELHDAAPRDAALALYDRYARGEIDVSIMCDLEAETVGDRPAEEFDALLAEVAEAGARHARADVRELLREARARGVAIHVVTASLAALVEATLRRAEIPYDRVSGTALRRDGDRVAAEVSVPSPLFEGKVRMLRDAPGWPAALGLGDGGWDHTFLREVYVPVLIHPKPSLRESMRGVARTIVLDGG